MPLVLVFELPISNNPTPDINSATIQQIVQLYNIGVNMKQRARGYSTTVTVRGSSSNAAGIKEGMLRLMEHLIGNLGVSRTEEFGMEEIRHAGVVTQKGPLELVKTANMKTCIECLEFCGGNFIIKFGNK